MHGLERVISAETRIEALRRRRRRRLYDRVETALIVLLVVLCAAAGVALFERIAFLEGGGAGILPVPEVGDPIAAPSPPRFKSAVSVGVIGRSLQRRPIEMESFGTGADRTLVIGGIHGSEYGGDVASAFASYLASHPEVLPEGVGVDVVPMANPDGHALGWRGNARHVDVNRNFPVRTWRPAEWRGTSAGAHPDSEPETDALVRILGRGYVRVVSLHSAGGFVDYDPTSARPLAERVAVEAGIPVNRLAGNAVYHGTLGQYVPERSGAPVLTIELDSPVLTTRMLHGLLVAVGARR